MKKKTSDKPIGMTNKNGKKIQVIIHNPNNKIDFDKYYSEVIVDTLKQLIQ